MEILYEIFENSGCVDGITILNLKGDILFSAKFNSKLHENRFNYEVVGKNFKDIYPKLLSENSTIFQAMKLGKPVYIKDQELEYYDGKKIYINSLSIPIKNNGKIVGAIDLSVENHKQCKKIIRDNYVSVIDTQFEKIIKELGVSPIDKKFSTDDIITENIEMKRMKRFIKEISNYDIPVLIYGETGTGKELVAQSLHTESNRKNKAFVAQNCASIPETLFESIFFGTTKGAYTNSEDAPGLFEMANGGTLFLDEINSMPLYLQSKLLRVIQEKKVRRLGSKETINIDVRLITAININPILAIEQKELRQDLYYRISMLKIDILPLRKRKEDIFLLAKYFIAKYNKIFKKSVDGISLGVDEKFRNYDWPGNVRELENLILLTISMMDENKKNLELGDIVFNNIKSEKEDEIFKLSEIEEIGINYYLEKCEKKILKEVLEKYLYNITRAAKALKIPRQTLHRKIKKYEL